MEPPDRSPRPDRFGSERQRRNSLDGPRGGARMGPPRPGRRAGARGRRIRVERGGGGDHVGVEVVPEMRRGRPGAGRTVPVMRGVGVDGARSGRGHGRGDGRGGGRVGGPALGDSARVGAPRGVGRAGDAGRLPALGRREGDGPPGDDRQSETRLPVDVTVLVRGYDIGDRVCVEATIGPFRKVPARRALPDPGLPEHHPVEVRLFRRGSTSPRPTPPGPERPLDRWRPGHDRAPRRSSPVRPDPPELPRSRCASRAEAGPARRIRDVRRGRPSAKSEEMPIFRWRGHVLSVISP